MRGKCIFTKNPDNHEKAKKRQFGYCLIFAEKTQLSTFKAVRTNTLWPWKKGAKELKNSLCSTYYVVFSLNHSWCWLLTCEEYFQLCKMCWNLNKDWCCCFSQSEPLRPHLNSHRGPSWSSIQGCLQSNFMSLIKNTEKRASFLLCGWLWRVMTESFLSNNERLVQNVIVNHCLFSLDLLP